MKDSEFIELLNLYLDHEISAADAARLEAEVQNNPARRKVYQQYCRMQKGCKLLAADFVSPEEAAASLANRKVVAFNVAAAEAAAGRRKRMGNFYVAGTFAAAAACVAIVFIGRSRQHEAAEAARLAAQEAKPAAAVQVAANPVAPAVTSGPRALGAAAGSAGTNTLLADPLLLAGKAQADALMAAAREQAKAQFAWLETMQLPPVQQPAPLNDLRFEATPAALRLEGRALGNRPATNTNGSVEMSAFQIVK